MLICIFHKEVFMTNGKDNVALGREIGFMRLLPAIIVVLASALALPFASNLYVGIAASGICSFFLIATAKKKIPVLLMLLLLIGTLGLPDGLPMITILLALTVGTGTYAWLLSYAPSPYLAIIPVLAYSATTVITKNWFGSLFALSFAIPAIVLAHSFKANASRIGGICRTSISFIIIACVGVVVSMLYYRGEFKLEALRDYADSFTASISEIFLNTEVELLSGETEALFTEDEAYNMALRIVTLFPAIAVLFFNSVSFFAQRLQFSLIKETLGDDAVSGRSIAFILSPFAGGAYVLSFLISTLTNSSPLDKTVNTVCQNIFVILTPALMGMGIMYFFAKMAIKRVKTGPLIIIGVLVLLFFNTQAALMLVACFGAYASISIPILTYLKEKSSKE